MNAVEEITFEQIRNAVDHMSQELRQMLFAQLLDKLEEERENDPDAPPSFSEEELHAELDRRLKDAHDHPERLLTWEQVKKELLEEKDD